MKKKDTKTPSRTDWKRVKAMSDPEIDCSDVPELGEDFFARAVLWPGPKKQITLRLDPDVLDFFKHQGRGYQRNINTVLRRYVELQRQRHAS
ncbi:MAG: BrnA antitoxin family protein [Acidobacteria bacterium]|nr:BrnA antitoxin family protein [Acidobacteriota bacterium]